MFMTENTHNYFYPTNSKHIVLECEKGRERGHEAQATIRPASARFIDALRSKRPTWRFKSTEYVYSSATQLVRFEVYDGDEALGHVWTDTHWRTGELRYHLTNHRILNGRRRGDSSFSSTLATAVKKAIDAFGAKSPNELALGARNDMHGVVYGYHSQARFEYDMTLRKVLNNLTDYVLRNWEALRAHAGTESSVDLPALFHAHLEGSDIYTAFDGKGGVMVMVRGESLILHRKGEDAYITTTSALTGEQRGRLGMLKLVEDRTCLPGIGARLNAETFFIMD